MGFFSDLLAGLTKTVKAQPIPVPRGTSFFDAAINRILAHEGGYVNHPKDPGGETNWGISKRSYPNLDIKHLTRDQAIAIYKRDYWDRIQGDVLPHSLAFQVLDFAINSGVGTAIRKLQSAAGVPEDGVLGPLTLSAIKSFSDADLSQLLIAERLEFYTSLSTFPSFGRGWTRRLAKNIRYNVTDT